MNIVIVGTGYVGLVSGVCFAEMGAHVTCVDIDQQKIEDLKKGILPIYEPGLEPMVLRNLHARRLQFTTNITDCLNSAEIVFSAVGTPPNEDGSADIHYVLEVARTVGKHMTNYLVFTTKSTVPVGTAAKVKQVIQEELYKRNVHIPFDIASNPEFLKEGDAIRDFMSPDRVVVGVETEKARKIMENLYRPFLLKNFRVLFMDVHSAEMTKYAANAMLATRISFMNQMANLCERVGADVNSVRIGIGSDTRIGHKFLYPGPGYGGSCFPKDVKALIGMGREHGYSMELIESVDRVNEAQKKVLFSKLQKYFKGALKGRTVAVWGLSFKPQTDDIREAPSMVLIESLLQAGCRVQAYDPVAMEQARRRLGKSIHFANDMYQAANDAHALILVTEWKEFRMPAWDVLRKIMHTPLVLDGRNIYNPQEIKEKGFDYIGIGLGS
ncbi:MAG: UDP-glucose/GDP-mannose dehydrogenase family protein [Bacteroidales bacterium]|jgi:UDPglucose 6-dehydrogenase|nr:UDP-glucose/GDP-mannose dehydrogenase family protein [Bacteroidales bacterium]MDD2264460.1 UDP-glucose/GDP-mannose dehydrogenase family protein [Bacteroidales bacterium]MDD2831695.1 UDP-glucose/GDP-mannose dehydrogenase family protein [Bacteroidales bacterium]MDD3208922.1 UDP-glucose/GDP-mannose dehydrogenase family protein [Bacteroidales bacterium]MDD3697706.1 UDP-glucose/GDP-mannose dehydrogenase family protein [Bacteroidales bacterium]